MMFRSTWQIQSIIGAKSYGQREDASQKLFKMAESLGKYVDGSFRYPLAMEGVHAPGGPACLAHTKQKVSNIVGLTALRLAFFMGFE